MLELKVALKYLLPRKKQLSVSIISLISTFVIALVVWLILVFFSVTNGLEKIWVSKMVTLASPIRVTPNEAYYNSYYHRIDSYSSNSNYSTKSLSEKLETSNTDPYNPDEDEKLPEDFPKSEKLAIAPLAKEAIDSIAGITSSLFELTAANLKLTLTRGDMQSTLSQAIYVTNFDPQNNSLQKVLLEPVSDLSSKEILLPKAFKEAGVKIGDKGVVAFFAPSASAMQEMRSPVIVKSFYDPGIIPVGGKLVVANPSLTRLIRSSQHQDEAEGTEGFNIRFDNLGQTDKIKAQLERAFADRGLSNYYKIETYREFEYTRDLIQQLHSEKNIFSLIATVIIIVACSNIISMLIILVNDKKTEIGILRSMGASSFTIASIFGISGTLMGLIGSLIGVVAAVLTIHNIDALIHLISRLQGFNAFNPLFFGNELPHEISGEALRFVIGATVLISMLSGLIPAYKASRLKPTEILRS